MKSNNNALARQFMNDQIAIMRKHGANPHVEGDRLEKAVKATERTFSRMTGSKPKATRVKVEAD